MKVLPQIPGSDALVELFIGEPVPPVQFDGHTFDGIVQWVGEQPVVLGVRDNDIASVAGKTSVCDATGQPCRRRPLYVFTRHADGAKVRVSESAVATHFLDVLTAMTLRQWVESYVELLHTIRESEPREQRTHYPVAEIIDTALAVIDKYGWVSRGQAAAEGRPFESTAALVQLVLTGEGHPDILGPRLCDRTLATMIVAWLDSIHADEANDDTLPDYLSALAAVASFKYIPLQAVGLLTSAPEAYRKHLASVAERVNRPVVDRGKHFGVCDVRQEATVKCLSIEPRGENEYGPVFLVDLVVVPTGEKLTWWTGEGCWMDVGETYLTRLTPKTHGEWNGFNVTTVGRVSLYERPPEKPKAAVKQKRGRTRE